MGLYTKFNFNKFIYIFAINKKTLTRNHIQYLFFNQLTQKVRLQRNKI